MIELTCLKLQVILVADSHQLEYSQIRFPHPTVESNIRALDVVLQY